MLTVCCVNKYLKILPTFFVAFTLSGCFQFLKPEVARLDNSSVRPVPATAVSGAFVSADSSIEKRNNETGAVSKIRTVDLVDNERSFAVQPVDAASASLISPQISAAGRQKITAGQGDLIYENTTISEDVTWRGTVFVSGSLFVSPQATVRIEPGTVVRFAKSDILSQAPKMVVMGRLHCSGKTDKPVLFTSNSVEAGRGEWGGVLFLSTEKKNQLEHFQIEGAEIALEAHHSNLFVTGGRIKNSNNGIFLYDSNANLSGVSISILNTGFEIHNSEADLREVVLDGNHKGIVAVNSSLAVTSTTVKGNLHFGMSLSECRIKIRSSEFSENAVGAIIKGGEGQLLRTRFMRNSQLALDLVATRTRVSNSIFAGNLRDTVRVTDSSSILYGNAFTGNMGSNLVNSGKERVIAVQNWWGSREESHVLEKLLDIPRNARPGQIIVSPWLMEIPSMLP